MQAASGGPAVSVSRLATEQARLGHDVAAVSFDERHLGPALPTEGVKRVLVPSGFLSVHGRGWSPEFRRALMTEARDADVVHNHGLWMWPNAYARKAAVAADKPLIFSPRGMLEPWSLTRSRLRKAVAWRLFEKKNLQAAAMFHATAEPEAQSIRHKAEGLRRAGVPIVVAPNGVDLPELSGRPVRKVLEEKFPQLKGRGWVVFMSRLHPKKGIDILLRAWSKQSATGVGSSRDKETKDLPLLLLAGPDLIGYRREVEKMVEELGLADSVVLTGELRGREKDCLLANAEIFVLPSYSENFGIAVAEAMAWARPVITTTGTPWREVAETGAGWWIRPEEAGLTLALTEALALSHDELEAKGAAGRRLVESKYSWGKCAQTLVAAYDELLGVKKQRPA